MPTAATYTYLDAIRHLPVGGALSVPDVSWADYQALLAELGDGYAVRITYDRERLEIVSPSDRHEKIKEFICAVAHVLADEMATDLDSSLTAEALTDLLQQLRTKGQQAVLTAFRQSLRR